MPPLHEAVTNEHESSPEMVRLLLEKGVDINQKSDKGMTPLHLAVQNKHESARKTVRLLLENGADINQKGYHQRTALFIRRL